MYYSKRGIPFEETFRACERKKNIKKILENVDLVQQTAGMGKLLQHYFLTNPLQEWVPLPEEEIEEVSKEVVDEFLLSIGKSFFVSFFKLFRIKVVYIIMFRFT